MKAFQINPNDQSVHQVDYTHTDYTSVLEAVSCDILNFTLLDSENVLYHGLLNTTNLDQVRPSFWMRRMGIHFGRAYIRVKGHGLIVTHDDDGKPADSTLTLEQVRDLVSFSEPAQVAAQAV
jgi:hypothetical protein